MGYEIRANERNQGNSKTLGLNSWKATASHFCEVKWRRLQETPGRMFVGSRDEQAVHSERPAA